MPVIPFTGNYSDHSTDLGFQFQFFCERCGNGYMSSFQNNKLGVAGEAMRGLGNVFGGFLGRAASGSFEMERMVNGRQHDAALNNAVAEIAPLFNQCQRCGQWVCRQVCTNPTNNFCTNCSPKLAGEIEYAKSQATVEQLQEKARATDFVKNIDLNQTRTGGCPRCGFDTGGAKFCPNCGLQVVNAKSACPRCQAEVTPGARFCPECGNKLG